MTGGLDTLFAAMVTFVGGHFLLSSAAVRGPLVRRFGEKPFLAGYSVVVIILFVWLLLAFRDAPTENLWEPNSVLAWIPAFVMPVALFFAVCGLTTPSPTMAGSDALTEGRDPTSGIMRITRHPFLNGVALWAAAHLLANGDTASVILFGGLFVLATGGMWHIDKKKEAQHAGAWGPVLLTTSAVPFVALAQKRTSFDWAGIGLWRVVVTAVIYLALVWAHPAVLGAAAWPGMFFNIWVFI
ncbi:MAG: NnrU protein [Alphaproteobacteria bacterium]|nr:NnrU protein [Alphaproteobacteria bacterium]